MNLRPLTPFITSQIRACFICAHSTILDDADLTPACANPKIADPDMPTPCKQMREPDGLCGVEAKFLNISPRRSAEHE